MTKDVLISIKGLQFSSDMDDALELICVGTYYFKNNKHYVIYEELADSLIGPTRNIAIISDKKFELKKGGTLCAHMVFEEKQKHMTYYETPVGSLVVGTNTSKVQVVEGEEEINIFVKYALDVNYEFMTDCEIFFKISAKKLEI